MDGLHHLAHVRTDSQCFHLCPKWMNRSALERRRRGGTGVDKLFGLCECDFCYFSLSLYELILFCFPLENAFDEFLYSTLIIIPYLLQVGLVRFYSRYVHVLIQYQLCREELRQLANCELRIPM